MTNREKFKEEILDIACKGLQLGVKTTGEPIACGDLACEDCICENCICENCNSKKIEEWANSEYVEPCPFERDELVEVSDDGQIWELRYFSHKEKERFYFYESGHTSRETNKVVPWIYCRKYGTLGGLVKENENAHE